MTLWLKMIGTPEQPWPVTQPYDRQYIGFRSRRPRGIRPGDQMILYAVRTGRIFALTRASKGWQQSADPGWPYRVDIAPCEINLAPQDGVDIGQIEEHLKTRLRRRSHIRLTEQEFDCAVAQLREAQHRLEPEQQAE